MNALFITVLLLNDKHYFNILSLRIRASSNIYSNVCYKILFLRIHRLCFSCPSGMDVDSPG